MYLLPAAVDAEKFEYTRCNEISQSSKAGANAPPGDTLPLPRTSSALLGEKERNRSSGGVSPSPLERFLFVVAQPKAALYFLQDIGLVSANAETYVVRGLCRIIVKFLQDSASQRQLYCRNCNVDGAKKPKRLFILQ